MSPNPPSHAHPPQESDALRAAANRRIAAFFILAGLLFATAIWIVLRKEKEVVVPRPTPTEPPPQAAAPPTAPPSAKPAREVPAPQPPSPPVTPALAQADQMEQALAAYRSAAAHLVAQRFEPAEEQALAALRAYPNLAAAQRLLGIIYIQQGRMDRAISVLEASLRNEPFHPEALTHLGFAYLQAGNYGLAMELVETCRRLHPDYKPALLQQGIMQLAEPGSSAAIESLRAAVEAFPTLPGPRNNLAVALARAGDLEGARAELTALLEIAPNNFSALFNMGALYAKETNAAAAVPWLRRAMAQIPPLQFRNFLNDPDLNPIRTTPEFQQMLQDLDPVFPRPSSGPRQ